MQLTRRSMLQATLATGIIGLTSRSAAPGMLSDQIRLDSSPLHRRDPLACLVNMDRSDIGSLLLAPPAGPSQAATRIANDRLARWTAQAPDRFQGLATLVTGGSESISDQLQRIADHPSLLGVRLQPGSAWLDHPRYHRLMAVASDRQLPLFLPGTSLDETHHVLRLILNGIFDRHDRLLVLMEGESERLAHHIARLDALYRGHVEDPSYSGRLARLTEAPSVYLLRHVRTIARWDAPGETVTASQPVTSMLLPLRMPDILRTV